MKHSIPLTMVITIVHRSLRGFPLFQNCTLNNLTPLFCSLPYVLLIRFVLAHFSSVMHKLKFPRDLQQYSVVLLRIHDRTC